MFNVFFLPFAFEFYTTIANLLCLISLFTLIQSYGIYNTLVLLGHILHFFIISFIYVTILLFKEIILFLNLNLYLCYITAIYVNIRLYFSVLYVNILLYKKVILLIYLNLHLWNKLKYLNIREKIIYIINKIQEDLYLLYLTSDQRTKNVISTTLDFYKIVVCLLGIISIISLLYYLIDEDLQVTLINLVIFYYMQLKMHIKKIIKSKLFNELCLILDRCYTIDDLGKAFFNIIKNTNIVQYLIQYIVLLFIVYQFSPLLCIYLIQLTISILVLFLGTMLLIYIQTNKYIKNNFFLKFILSITAVLMILYSFILIINTGKKIDNLFKVYMNRNNPNSNPNPNTGNNGSSNPNPNPNPNESEDSLIASNTIENENRDRENSEIPIIRNSTPKNHPNRRRRIEAGEEPDSLSTVEAKRQRYDRTRTSDPVLVKASDSTQTGEEYKKHTKSFRLEGVREYKPDSTLGFSGPSRDLTYLHKPGMPTYNIGKQTFVQNIPVYTQNVAGQNVPYVPAQNIPVYTQNVARQNVPYVPTQNVPAQNVPVFGQPTGYIPRNESYSTTGQINQLHMENGNPFRNNNYSLNPNLNNYPTMEQGNYLNTTPVMNTTTSNTENLWERTVLNNTNNETINTTRNSAFDLSNILNNTNSETTNTTRNSAFDLSNILNNTNNETTNTTRNSAFDLSNILNTPKLGEKRKRGLGTEELGRFSTQNLTSSKRIKR